MSEELKTYGQIAYEAYCAATGARSIISGDPLPSWDELDVLVDGERITEAWMAAGRAVDEQVRADGTDLTQARARVAELEAQLADGGAEHPSCDAHRWYAVVRHYGSFAYGFAATSDGLRVWDDASEFEHARAGDFE